MLEKLSLNKMVLIGAGVAAFVVVAILVVLYALPALGIGGGGYTRLDADNPTLLHRDGLLVTWQSGEPLGARLDTVPREQFLAGQGGTEMADANTLLPPDLVLLSPIYVIETQEDPDQRLVAEMNIPNGAEPLETLSLYAWDGQAGKWSFVPSRQDIVRDVVRFVPAGQQTYVAAMQRQAALPGIGLVVRFGATLDAAVAQSLEVALPAGVALQADGALAGEPANVQAGSAAVTPLVEGEGVPPEAAVENLAGLAADYAGLALDVQTDPEDRDAYSAFVVALADRLHADGGSLAVVVRGGDLAAYDLTRLSESADLIWWAPGDDPTQYVEGNDVQTTLYALVGDVDRRKLGLLVGSSNVEVSPSGAMPLTSDEALDVFGEVTPIEGYLSEEGSTFTGEQIPFRLTGALQAMAYDPTLGANYLAYTGEGGQTHYVYFASAEGLTRKLGWAERYGLSAIAVENDGDALAVDAATSGLSAYIAQAPAAPPPELNIAWQVTGGEDTSISETAGDLAAIQYLWVAADEPGDYVISAAVNGQASSQRGEVLVMVAQGGRRVVVAEESAGDEEATADGEVTTPGVAPVVAAGGAAGGGFELGGQVRGAEYYGFMHQAGMTWVKYQLRGLDNVGGAAANIGEAHANGFKVLLSVLGGHEIDYNAWANYLGQVAALGPDAIEIWNEPNFSREWPANQLGGENYVNLLLAPAYNAIKAANPNVMVISGAPTPTGAFSGGCPSSIGELVGCNDDQWINGVAAAGGANYMDCVGVHYNAGTTSPYANSGSGANSAHYSWYFQPMMNVYSVVGRPLCFTELGYVVGPGLPSSFAWGNNTTVENQAQWMAETAQLAAQSGRVRLMIVWNVGGYGGSGGGDPQGAYAIVRGGGCPACQTLGSVMGVQ